MIQEIYNYGEHAKYPTYTLLIHDTHGEYPFPNIGMPKDKRGFEGHVEVIWDHPELEEILGEDVALEASKHFPDDLLEHWNEDFGPTYIWRIRSSLDQLEWLFDRQMSEVFDRCPSGDDDVFDYWPGAMEMIDQLVHDLETITGHEGHYQKFKARYIGFIREHGRILEFTFDLEDKELCALEDALEEAD